MNENSLELSVIIPLYNEEKRFPKSFLKIEKFFQKVNLRKEYIFIDDGSVDKTLEIIKKIKSDSLIKVFTNVVNKGKGAALKLGVKYARGKVIFFTDADLSTPIEEFKKLYSYIDRYDMVIGSRRVGGSQIRVAQPFHRRFLGSIFYLIYFLFFSRKVKDTNCGFKCYRYKAAKHLYGNTINSRWGFDAEVIYLAEKYGYIIKEVPIIWLNDPHSRVSTLGASLNTIMELAKIKINDLIGFYNSSVKKFSDGKFTVPRENDIPRSFVEKLTRLCFSVFFGTFFLFKGKVVRDAHLSQTLSLYSSKKGFDELFLRIRTWDAPFEELEKLVPEKGRIYDLGCGDGIMSNYLGICSLARVVTGIELNTNRIRYANIGLKNVYFKQGNILKEKLPRTRAILLVHVLHHLPSYGSQEAIIKKCFDSLEKRGKLIVTEIVRKPFLKYIITWCTDAFIVPILFEKRNFSFDFFYRGKKEWEELFRKSGFKVKSLEAHHGKPFSHIIYVAEKI